MKDRIMDALSPPSLSDRQGFNKRWFADSSALQVYRPTSAQSVYDAVIAIQASGISGSAVQVTCGRHCYEGFVYNENTRAIIDVTALTTTMLERAYQGLTTPVSIPSQSGLVDMSQSLIQFDSYGGQINKVAYDDTAIYQRDSIAKLQYQSYWTTNVGPGYDDEALEDAHLTWMKNIYEGVYVETGGVPSGTGLQGCYYNYPDIDLGSTAADTPPLEDALELYFGPNLTKLKGVAASYNDGKWFSNSQSICNLT
jgi:hypothetical protein